MKPDADRVLGRESLVICLASPVRALDPSLMG